MKDEDLWGTLGLYTMYIVLWIGSGWSVLTTDLRVAVVLFGLVGVGVGTCGRVLAMRSLGRYYASGIALRVNHRLITSGPYAVVHHPLHVFLAVETAGMAVLLWQYWGVMVWLVLMWLILRRNGREDASLRGRFGERAIAYQKEVPAMNPFPVSYRLVRRALLRGDQKKESVPAA